MKKYLALIIGVYLFFTSCDNRGEYFDSLNFKPKLSFLVNKDLKILSDSIKVSKSIADPVYTFSIEVFDQNNNLMDLNVEQSAGEGVLLGNSKPITGPIFSGNKEVIDFIYAPKRNGFHDIEFIQFDGFGISDTIHFKLEVFENLKPVADLKIFYSGIRSKYEYYLNAKDSYDTDERFGGGIKAYEYIINGLRVPMYKDEIPWIFDGRGIHQVELRILDTDNEWSTIVKQEVVIE